MKMEFTEKELILTSELRNSAAEVLGEDYEKKDEFLITWIRYKSNDVKKAEQSLRNHVEWKKQAKLELTLLEDWKDLEEFLPVEMPGFDKDGCPVVGMDFNKDLRTVVNVPGGKERFLRFMIREREKCASVMRKKHFETEGCVNQIVILCNMGDFIFSQMTSTTVISILKELVKSTEENYPGVLKTLYVLNTPRMFKVVFEVVKPFFSSDTLSRLKLFGYERKQWRKVLLENIEDNQLPSFARVQEK